jgi:hypothetical protein
MWQRIHALDLAENLGLEYWRYEVVIVALALLIVAGRDYGLTFDEPLVQMCANVIVLAGIVVVAGRAVIWGFMGVILGVGYTVMGLVWVNKRLAGRE